MYEGAPKQFSSPSEEIEYLRNQIAARERELLHRTPEVDQADIETVSRQEIKSYTSFTPKMVLDKDYALTPEQVTQSAEAIAISHDPIEDILQIAYEKGIKNALTVLEQTNNTYVVDEVHRQLIEQIRSGAKVADLKEGVSPWHILHMTLYEVTLPAMKLSEDGMQQLQQLVGTMEQLFMGLRTIGTASASNHFVIEVAVAESSDDIIFYASVPNEFTTLFEKQTLSLFPHAVLLVQPHDYNIFVNDGAALVSEVTLKKHPIYPIKVESDFTADPFAVILNAFSKIEREGGGAALQFVIRFGKNEYHKTYESIIKEVDKGVKPSEAISRSTMAGEFRGAVTDLIFNKKKEEKKEEGKSEADKKANEQFRKKITSEIVETNIRMVVSATDARRADQILREIESTFNQFSSVDGNSFVMNRQSGVSAKRALKAFSFREFSTRNVMPLSLKELSSLVHFPSDGIHSTPQFKQSYANTAPAPNDMPTEGSILGINKHRGSERPIYVSEKDRMRHFYVIGQTGTGKSKFLTNLIIQDIQAGHGVCFIDPHGTDIEEVLGAIPPHREQDVIYFDPSRMDRAVGLNMLEYDYRKPEQKTFVVNELFSIFQKLYGANPESMGPMFEQYFRNATMLVMEDPESGNTLMDISRVMADARYRRQKLEKATNPVVVQFWREIATKAGGEAALENIVPYIVSKFDVFTANDFMRPIIGQQQSAFNFRMLMDEKKILLVNLSKGRLGEINANLIGMIFVGKILMAALSRVDDPTGNFPPFFLHIDEFQNISTPAISSILSEARKYKLGLTVAHQFIAQLDPAIKDAVFGNVGSMAAFRVGNEDAQFLEQQFHPAFSAHDLMNIPNFNAYMRVLANGVPTTPFSVAMNPPIVSDPARAAYLREQSLQRYGRPRDEVEEEIRLRYQKPVPPPPLPAVPDMM
ncbi:MAG: hypothetical protein RL538_438 [Candidatus Parcubacteria bacterium]|jgi:hypothetical protein